MRKVANNSGRLVVELLLVMPFLIAIVLVSSEIARFVRCKQAISVLVSEVGKSAYRACGQLREEPVGGLSGPAATTRRTEICLQQLMLGGGSGTGFVTFSNSLAAYLQLQSINVRASVYEGTGTGLIASYPTSLSAAPISKFQTSSATVRPSAAFMSGRTRFVVIEASFPVTGMMSFSRAFRLSGISANGEVYESALF